MLLYKIIMYYQCHRNKNNMEETNTISEPFPIIGYCTGNFDLLHADHIKFLKSASDKCRKLIVGVTVDVLAEQTKRLPLCTYKHRSSTILSLPFVHSVVPHVGRSKAMDHAIHGFDILFSSSEYIHSEEFRMFADSVPFIPVVFIPRGMTVSTTEIKKSIEYRSEPNILAIGNAGPLYVDNSNTVVTKHIHLSPIEMTLIPTSNYIDVRSPPPWYSTRDELGFYKYDELPNDISGANGLREIAAGEYHLMCGFKWSTYISSKIVYNNVSELRNYPITPQPTLLQLAHDVSIIRSFPAGIISIRSKYGGITFIDFARLHPYRVRDVYNRVVKIIEEIQMAGFVHTDIHPRNVIVDNDNNVYIIDWGWCMSDKFEMCTRELERYKRYIDTNEDLRHWTESCNYCVFIRDLINDV